MNTKQKSARDLASIVGEARIPKAVEAEMSILGSILVAGVPALVRAQAIIQEQHLYRDPHRVIFRVVTKLHQRGTTIDIVTVREELRRCDDLEVIGGPAYVASLVEGMSRSVNVDHYCSQVLDAYVRRSLMERAIEMARSCTNGHETSELLEAGANLYRASLAADPDARRRILSIHELMKEYADSVARGKGRKLWTGIRALDAATDGIAPGEVQTYVARPQVGKSALASQILLNAAVEGEPCVFFSLEMPREQAFERLVQQRLGLSRHQVAQLAKDKWRNLTTEQRAELNAMAVNLVIIDRGKSGITELDASMLEAAAILGRPPRLVAIDYLGLLSSGAKNLPLYQHVSAAAIDVKLFAKRHQVAVILLSQAGREQDPEKTEGAAPLGLDAARDSGVVEEAADFLVTLWRPELSSRLSVSERAEVKDQLWAAVAKNRRGPRPTIKLHLDTQTLRVSERNTP